MNALTLVRQEVQHGLQEEGQVPDGEGGIPHPAGGVDQLVKQTRLDGGPAAVRACNGRRSASGQCGGRRGGPRPERAEQARPACGPRRLGEQGACASLRPRAAARPGAAGKCLNYQVQRAAESTAFAYPRKEL